MVLPLIIGAVARAAAPAVGRAVAGAATSAGASAAGSAAAGGAARVGVGAAASAFGKQALARGAMQGASALANRQPDSGLTAYARRNKGEIAFMGAVTPGLDVAAGQAYSQVVQPMQFGNR